jgi:hypothetical protein
MMDLTVARDLFTVAYGEEITQEDFAEAAIEDRKHPMRPVMNLLREKQQFMWVRPREGGMRKLVPEGTQWSPNNRQCMPMKEGCSA